MRNRIIYISISATTIFSVVVSIVTPVIFGIFLEKIGFTTNYAASVVAIMFIGIGVGGFGNINSGLKNLKQNIKSATVFTLVGGLFAWYLACVFYAFGGRYKVPFDYDFALGFSLIFLLSSIGFLIGRSLSLEE